MNRLIKTGQLRSRLQATSIPRRYPVYSDLRPMSTSTSSSSAAPKAAETDTEAALNANATGVTPASLEKTLKDKLAAVHVDIEDMSGGCGQMFQAAIVSAQFEKKNTLARHRLVNSALKEEIAAIHAWTPKCFTPEEWQRKGNT